MLGAETRIFLCNASLSSGRSAHGSQFGVCSLDDMVYPSLSSPFPSAPPSHPSHILCPSVALGHFDACCTPVSGCFPDCGGERGVGVGPGKSPVLVWKGCAAPQEGHLQPVWWEARLEIFPSLFSTACWTTCFLLATCTSQLFLFWPEDLSTHPFLLLCQLTSGALGLSPLWCLPLHHP